MCVIVTDDHASILADVWVIEGTTAVDDQRMRSGPCWFGASCFGAIGFVLVLAGINASAGASWSRAGLIFVLLAGVALIGMAVLMALGFRIEQHDSPPGGNSRGSAG